MARDRASRQPAGPFGFAQGRLPALQACSWRIGLLHKVYESLTIRRQALVRLYR